MRGPRGKHSGAASEKWRRNAMATVDQLHLLFDGADPHLHPVIEYDGKHDCKPRKRKLPLFSDVPRREEQLELV